jgi:hypothetical protein
MIPKIINYCWFGGNPYPQILIDCLVSWKKFCPDYKIIEWNESNFDYSKCIYSKQAYEAKMWAFVSDYARLKIIFDFGGVYVDTDVEILKNIDSLLSNKAFMGFQDDLGINTGLIFGSIPKLPIIGELVKEYETLSFLDKDGKFNLTSCVSYQTNTLEGYGLIRENKIQWVEEIKIYPTEYFCPFNIYTGKLNITDLTYSFHKFDGSWAPETGRYGNKLKWKYMNKYGVFFGRLIRILPYSFYIIKHHGLIELFYKIRNRFKLK